MAQEKQQNTVNKDQSLDEYHQHIKQSVEDGSYFKDALNWYFFRYVTPICDRTILIFGAIVAAVVLFFLVQMIRSAFPLVEEKPIFIKSFDQSRVFPNLVKLKFKEGEEGYDQNIATIDEAVLKYLLQVYVDERESYDFSKAEVKAVNRKFNHIKNNSSAAEYKSFQLIMSRDNPDSPINNFGKNVNRKVTIESVKLIKKEKHGFAQKARDFLLNEIPQNAEVRFVTNTRYYNADSTVNKAESARFIAKINFSFDGVSPLNGSRLNFVVKGYRLFKIQ